MLSGATKSRNAELDAERFSGPKPILNRTVPGHPGSAVPLVPRPSGGLPSARRYRGQLVPSDQAAGRAEDRCGDTGASATGLDLGDMSLESRRLRTICRSTRKGDFASSRFIGLRRMRPADPDRLPRALEALQTSPRNRSRALSSAGHGAIDTRNQPPDRHFCSTGPSPSKFGRFSHACPLKQKNPIDQEPPHPYPLPTTPGFLVGQKQSLTQQFPKELRALGRLALCTR